MNIYQIEADLQEVIDTIIENGGEITPEIEERLAELEQLEERKLSGYRHVLINVSSERKAIEAERKRLQDMETTLKNTERSLKDRVFWAFKTRGVDRMNLKVGKFWIQANGGKEPVVINTEPEALPQHFQRIEVTADVDALREALENGEVIPGVYIGERGEHLRYR